MLPGVRHEHTAYGSRAEIRELVESGLNAGRSARRREELLNALIDLNNGENSVTFGHCTYIVEEEEESSKLAPS